MINETSISYFFKNYLKKNIKTKPILVNNFKWLGKLNYIKFLREVGKHFTINKMLSFDSVKLRLEREQSLSYMEFNYMILQAYDFIELNKNLFFSNFTICSHEALLKLKPVYSLYFFRFFNVSSKFKLSLIRSFSFLISWK